MQNAVALQGLLTNQSVQYDFEFYPLSFNHNVPVLVLSEGRSMLPTDAHVHVGPAGPVVPLALSDEQLDQFRWYLGTLSSLAAHTNFT